MKRTDPKTGKLLRQGDVRSDGKHFWKYKKHIILKNGFFAELWLSPEVFTKEKQKVVNWSSENTEYQSKWLKENPAKRTALDAKRRAAKLQRTPNWLTKEHYDQIEGFYLLAKEMTKQLGAKYEVDHIEALQGDDVSGLHVPWNLQVLSKPDNIRKSNKRVN